jgi:hypothetical protein
MRLSIHVYRYAHRDACWVPTCWVPINTRKDADSPVSRQALKTGRGALANRILRHSHSIFKSHVWRACSWICISPAALMVRGMARSRELRKRIKGTYHPSVRSRGTGQKPSHTVWSPWLLSQRLLLSQNDGHAGTAAVVTVA